MKKVLFFVLIASSILISSCSNSSSSGAGQAAFFDSAKQTAPAITATLSASSVKTNVLTWASGNIMYELFNMLRDYNNDTDAGKVGIDNIYSALYTASGRYDSNVSSCTTVTAQVIASPFNFGNSETYNCAGSDAANGTYFAYDKTSSTIQKALISFTVASSTGTEYTVMQGSHDDNTKIVNLDLAAYVDYTAQNDYSMRLHIAGNESTHTFTLKSMKYTNGGYWVSIVGYGVSRGTGQYFLFKVKDAENLSNATKYFCFQADSTETTLSGLVTSLGSDTVDANCAAYKDTVDAMTLFTSSDVPTALSSFTNSSLGLTYQP